MRSIISRRFRPDLSHGKSAFLWGPRKTGKTYWIRHHLKDVVLIDLLKTDVLADYAARPALLRERYSDCGKLIVIDEVQKLPQLLDEAHWMIENRGSQFLLTGSSARKLRRGDVNLLGGRALRYSMTPLSFVETRGFDLESAMVSGMLPSHFLEEDPRPFLQRHAALTPGPRGRRARRGCWGRRWGWRRSPARRSARPCPPGTTRAGRSRDPARARRRRRRWRGRSRRAG